MYFFDDNGVDSFLPDSLKVSKTSSIKSDGYISIKSSNEFTVTCLGNWTRSKSN